MSLAWEDALWGLACVCADPPGTKGVWLRAYHGATRARWMSWLKLIAPRIKQVPSHIDQERLMGGLDLGATLEHSRPIMHEGVLVQAHQSILLAPMAEKLPLVTAAQIAQVMDTQKVRSASSHAPQDSVKNSAHETDTDTDSAFASAFALVAIDESMPDETALAPALQERVSIGLDLRDVHLSCSLEVDADQELGADTSAETIDMLFMVEKFLKEDHLFFSKKLKHVQCSDAQIKVLCETALELGIESLRAPLAAAYVARVLCLLRLHDSLETIDTKNSKAALSKERQRLTLQPSDEDMGRAARLTLTPWATQLPDLAQRQNPQQHPKDSQEDLKENPSDPTEESSKEMQDDFDDQHSEEPQVGEQNDQQTLDIQEMQEIVLEAALAHLPPALLAQLNSNSAAGARASGGTSGEIKKSKNRGRPLPPVPGMPSAGARLHVLATLRHAAPRQKIRQLQSAPPRIEETKTTVQSVHPLPRRLLLRSEDFHVHRYAQRTQTCIIFAIDASGSSALHRLAEAKGAVELLLQDSYARRDHICVISFRAKAATLELPPTRSLVRAKRGLSALPGGGGTPLASALKLAFETAENQKRAGMTPSLVILSDGRANVTLSGEGGRDQAMKDAVHWASLCKAHGLQSVWLDTSQRPDPLAEKLAIAMAASYVPLPAANSQRMAQVVQAIGKP
jgi:magnesium chelatase subunit D